MNDHLKQQIADDIELAQKMSDINSPAEILDLTNRLVGYQDLILTEIAVLSYKISQLKGKANTLKEYMRTSKERYKEVRDIKY